MCSHNNPSMNPEEVNYDAIVEQQAKLIQKRGGEKRKSIIAKDVQYFDSTEITKMLNQNRDVESTDPQPQTRQWNNN